MSREALVQVAIATFGLGALAMSYFGGARVRRWSPFVGLAGQPFWIAFSIETHAWGLVPTVVGFSLVYVAEGARSVRYWRNGGVL